MKLNTLFVIVLSLSSTVLGHVALNQTLDDGRDPAHVLLGGRSDVGSEDRVRRTDQRGVLGGIGVPDVRRVAGDLAAQFYIGVAVIGIVIPLIITINNWGGGVVDSSGGVLFLRFLCVLIGDLMMRFCIMKSSVHTPLIGALAG